MRISDWSSDVCSSDLGRGSYRSLYLDFRAVGLLHRAQAHLRIHIQDQADDAEEAEAAGDACRRHDRALSEGRAGTLTTALRTVSEGQSRMSRTVAVVRSEEHTSELQSLMRISYAVFCLKKKKKIKKNDRQLTR